MASTLYITCKPKGETLIIETTYRSWYLKNKKRIPYLDLDKLSILEFLR